jgi:Cdc6-like AAA superfamily ATPase
MPGITVSEFEFKTAVSRGKQDLEKVVNRNTALLGNLSSSADYLNKYLYDNLLDNFIGIFYSLNKKLSNSPIFDGTKEKTRIILNYSLWNASKAILNTMNDSSTRTLYKDSPVDFDPANIGQGSEHSMGKSVLNQLENLLGTDYSNFKPVIFKFFNDAKEYTKQNLLQISKNDPNFMIDIVKNLKPAVNGFDFSDCTLSNAPEPTEPKAAASEVGKYIPENIPVYSDTNVDWTKCVGNQGAIEKILNEVFKSLRYNSKTQTNEFLLLKFENNILIYGPPGVGKTMAVDGVVKWARDTAKSVGKELYVTDMSTALKTCMYDISGKILEEFYKKEEQGDKIYLNIFDENGGGKFGNPYNGGNNNQEDQKFMETAKKVMGRKYKGNVVNIIITNYTTPESVEAAFQQRWGFKLGFSGPETANDFGQILEFHMANLAQLGIVNPNTNWAEVGQIFADYKAKYQHLEEKNFFVTGRTVEKFVNTLEGEGDLYNKTHLLSEESCPGEQIFYEYAQLHQKINQPMLKKLVQSYMQNEIGSLNFSINKQDLSVVKKCS